MAVSKKKRLPTRDADVILMNNVRAMEEGPTKKRWSKHDLKSIRPLTNNQHDLFQQYFQGDNIIVYGSAGTGKAQPLYSKILTPDGWKLMGDINLGDSVVTPSGDTSMVTGVFPQGMKEIFEITFHDGSKTHSCGEHLWEVYVANSSGKQNKVVLPLSEIHTKLNHFQTEDVAKTASRKNISIDLISPMNTHDQSFVIDPYSMGLLLGDGSFRGQGGSIIFSTTDPEMLDHLKSNLVDGGLCTFSKMNDIDTKLKGLGNRENGVLQKSPLYKEIVSLGLEGAHSVGKFIPTIYKLGSLDQRWALLQGLMDTDGTAGKKGAVTFCSVSPQLSLDVQELVWSLGGTCTITQRVSHYTNPEGDRISCKIAYTLHIRVPFPKMLFRLERKKERVLEVHANGRVALRRRIVKISPAGTEEAQCIMIDHPSHLYVTDDYIVTHNTYLSVFLAMCDVLDGNKPQDHVIIVRSVVTTRDIGFLPGTVEEKVSLFETPYKDILADLCGRTNTYDNMKDVGLIKFIPTSYIRGLTWDNAVVIIEEGQNMTGHEIHSVMTRIGKDTRVLFTGDLGQNDLEHGKRTEKSGMKRLLKVTEKMKEFSSVCFTSDDIVRSDFVKSWIVANELVPEE